MSWVPPELAKPACSHCISRAVVKLSHLGIEVEGGEDFALQDCRLRVERRYIFRKNPPRPDMSDNGENCKRYRPTQAAGSKLAEDWVEFPPPNAWRHEREASGGGP